MPATTSLKLPESLKEKIAELVRGVAQTPHAYMVEAIAEKVARDEKRQDFVRAALQSMKEVGATGIAYAHEDVWRYALARAAGKRATKPRAAKRRSAKR